MIGQSKDDLLKSLDHLQPVLQRLYEAGDDLAPGLNLLVSFPFPKEASEIVKGDYANTSIRADINLENLLPTGDPGGGIPPILPDPGGGAHPGGEVPAQRRPHQQGLPEGARLGEPGQAASEDLQEEEVRRQPGLHDHRGAAGRRRRRLPDLPGLPELPGGLGGLLGLALSGGDPTAAPSAAALYGGAP